MAQITLKGTPINTSGDLPAVGGEDHRGDPAGVRTASRA